jgi:hypothetical protein
MALQLRRLLPHNYAQRHRAVVHVLLPPPTPAMVSNSHPAENLSNAQVYVVRGGAALEGELHLFVVLPVRHRRSFLGFVLSPFDGIAMSSCIDGNYVN